MSAVELAELYCPICEQQFETGEMCPNDGHRLVRLRNQIDPFLGRDLDGRFTIVERLGAGGMGAVYRARQHSVDREIAIKVIHPNLVSDPTSIKRFLREAKIASVLAHPNVVAVMDFGQARDGTFWLAMELVEGRTLDEVVRTDGPFSVARLVRVALQILDALEGAHAVPIVHRDLKPANIMMLAHGRDLVKVLDFGLAKSLALDASNATMTGALLGTPAFMPAEIANGEAVDGRADLYSLGCILYFLGTGRPPFVTDSVPEMIAMHGTMIAPPMPGAPAPIAAFVARLLAKKPAQRFASAAEARGALEAAYEMCRADERMEDAETSVSISLRRAPEPTTVDAPAIRTTSETRVETTVQTRRRSRAPWVAVGAIAIAGGVAAALALGGGAGSTHAAATPAGSDAASGSATETASGSASESASGSGAGSATASDTDTDTDTASGSAAGSASATGSASASDPAAGSATEPAGSAHGSVPIVKKRPKPVAPKPPF